MLQVGPTGQALDIERYLKQGNCSASENTQVSFLRARDPVGTYHQTNKLSAGEMRSTAAQMAEPRQNEDLGHCVLAWRMSSKQNFMVKFIFLCHLLRVLHCHVCPTHSMTRSIISWFYHH